MAWVLTAAATSAILFTYNGAGLENGFLFMTGPWCLNSNPIIGYSRDLVDGAVHHLENYSVISDQLMLAGGEQNTTFYALRPGTGLLAFLLFPYLSAVTAAKAVLWSLTVAASLAIFSLGSQFGLSRLASALFALVAVSATAVLLHTNDISAHLPGAAFWLICIAVILRLRPWEATTPWTTLLMVHALLIFGMSIYSANVVPYIALVVLQLPHWSRFFASLLLFVSAYQLKAAWAYLINALYRSKIDYFSIESRYLADAIAKWKVSWQHGGVNSVLTDAWSYTSQFIFSEILTTTAALLLLSGLAFAAFKTPERIAPFLRDRRTIFLACCMAGTLAVGLVWAPSAPVRGYISYGLPLSVLTLAALLFATQLPASLQSRLLLPALLAIFVLQHLWGHAMYAGNPVAACQYFLGRTPAPNLLTAAADGSAEPLVFLPTGAGARPHTFGTLVSTLAEELPRLQAVLPSARALSLGAHRNVFISFGLTAFLLLPAGAALALAMARRGHRRLWSVCSGLAAISISWGAAWILSNHGKSAPTDTMSLVAACRDSKTIAKNFDITLSKEALSAIRRFNGSTYRLLSGTEFLNRPRLSAVSIGRHDLPHAQWISLDMTLSPNSVGLPPEQYPALSDGPGLKSEQLLGLLGNASGPVTLVVEEKYNEPVTSFFAWRPANDSDSASSTCGVPAEPFVELRGYRPGDLTPRLYIYRALR